MLLIKTNYFLTLSLLSKKRVQILIHISNSIYISRENQINRKNVKVKKPVRLLCVIIDSFLDLQVLQMRELMGAYAFTGIQHRDVIVLKNHLYQNGIFKSLKRFGLVAVFTAPDTCGQ